MNIICFLLIGWILSWFKFERVVIRSFKELFNKEITIASYYFIFFCVGAIGDMVLVLGGDYYNNIFQ